jgi:hypothetical protein
MRYQTALRSDRGEAFISEATPPQSSIRHAHLPTSTSPLKSSTKWAVAVMPLLAEGLPADHPSLDPIWREAQEYDLPIANHSLTWTPPYYPGYRDLYDNIFLGRLAAAFIGGGLFDRFPNLRMGVFGVWLRLGAILGPAHGRAGGLHGPHRSPAIEAERINDGRPVLLRHRAS